MWRGVVLTHAVCILHLRPRDFNWDTSGCSPFLRWFFKANCCLPLPYFTSDILVQYDILRTLKNTLHFGDKNNISKSSGWCLQQMLKKDSNSSRPVSVTVWWVGFFWGFFFTPLRCKCQILSAVEWDKREICAGTNMAGRQLETDCLNQLLNQDTEG